MFVQNKVQLSLTWHIASEWLTTGTAVLRLSPINEKSGEVAQRGYSIELFTFKTSAINSPHIGNHRTLFRYLLFVIHKSETLLLCYQVRTVYWYRNTRVCIKITKPIVIPSKQLTYPPRHRQVWWWFRIQTDMIFCNQIRKRGSRFDIAFWNHSKVQMTYNIYDAQPSALHYYWCSEYYEQAAGDPGHTWVTQVFSLRGRACICLFDNTTLLSTPE